VHHDENLVYLTYAECLEAELDQGKVRAAVTAGAYSWQNFDLQFSK
jgi:hypothetical protein